MFAQFIRATVGDRDTVEKAMDRWDRDLRPGAEGFLGSTSGITTNGEFVLIARFDSPEAARRNSDRSEQGEWWAEVEKGFAGPATFFESDQVDIAMGGGSDDAGFVQVMLGRADRQAVTAAMEGGEAVMRRERPDIIGGITLWGEDGRFVDANYFTSEAEARAAESREPSGEARELFERFQEVMPVEEWLDLPAPRLA